MKMILDFDQRKLLKLRNTKQLDSDFDQNLSVFKTDKQ